ncbi:MAG: hypothetical protein AB8B55_02420 [Mariniblastus sp.]
MTREDTARETDPTIQSLDSNAILALQRLKETHDTASNFGRNSWDFAVELSEMGKSGIDNHVLRMLVCKKWITHKREVTDVPQERRSFEEESELVFSARSCFIITKEGYRIATRLSEQVNANSNPSGVKTPCQSEAPPSSLRSVPHFSVHHSEPANTNQMEKPNSNAESANRPVWDRQRRELRLGDVVVKRFKWPAENQERVLNAFEDLGWPNHIEDPLVEHPTICAKRRLHDTLKCLNRKQIREMIKFRGDGTGRGVRLEINLDG